MFFLVCSHSRGSDGLQELVGEYILLPRVFFFGGRGENIVMTRASLVTAQLVWAVTNLFRLAKPLR